MTKDKLAEMPRPDFSWLTGVQVDAWVIDVARSCLDVGAQVQREILWKEGWRKVPSEDSLAVKLARLIKAEEIDNVRPLAEELHRWFMEGE